MAPEHLPALPPQPKRSSAANTALRSSLFVSSAIWVALAGCNKGDSPTIDPELAKLMEKAPDKPLEFDDAPDGHDLIGVLRSGKECSVHGACLRMTLEGSHYIVVARLPSGKTGRFAFGDTEQSLFDDIMSGKTKFTMEKCTLPNEGDAVRKPYRLRCKVEHMLAGLANLKDFSVRDDDLHALIHELAASELSQEHVSASLPTSCPDGSSGIKGITFKRRP